jgi:hypothetical protein
MREALGPVLGAGCMRTQPRFDKDPSAITGHSITAFVYSEERIRNIIGSPHCVQAFRSTDYLNKTCNIIVITIK